MEQRREVWTRTKTATHPAKRGDERGRNCCEPRKDRMDETRQCYGGGMVGGMVGGDDLSTREACANQLMADC